MARTDTHVLVVCNHATGERHSFVGTLKECKQVGEEKRKQWGKKNTEAFVEKR